jgi:hypothetical protein
MKEQQKKKYELHTANQNESALFFSGQKDDDARLGCVGHFRCDFGRKGKEFWHNWFDHIPELKTPAFQEDFQSVIDELRKCGPLKDLKTMAEFCGAHADARLASQYHSDAYGFKLETEAYSYYLRCFPQQGDYNAYVYCYGKNQQQMAMGENEQVMNQGMSQQM